MMDVLTHDVVLAKLGFPKVPNSGTNRGLGVSRYGRYILKGVPVSTIHGFINSSVLSVETVEVTLGNVGFSAPVSFKDLTQLVSSTTTEPPSSSSPSQISDHSTTAWSDLAPQILATQIRVLDPCVWSTPE